MTDIKVIDVAYIEMTGPEQAQKPAAFRLCNGETISIGCALAMVTTQNARFRHKVGDVWKDLLVIHRKIWISEFAI